MYRLMSIISYFIRQFMLPNPFTNLFNPGLAFFANLIFGGILILLSYVLTGTWYDGEEPFIGSFGFLVNYALLTSLILGITAITTNIYLVSFLFILGYAVLCVIENKLFSDKLNF